MNSPMYNYIRNQYIMGKFSDEDLIKLVELKRITDEERLEIMKIRA